MTNRQRFEKLPTHEFVEALRDVFRRQNKYIDLEAWFDGEDEDLMHYIKAKGLVTTVPSEYEVKAYENELIAAGKPVGKGILDTYVKDHTRTYPYLDNTTMLGTEYAVIYNTDVQCVMKIPMANVTIHGERS